MFYLDGLNYLLRPRKSLHLSWRFHIYWYEKRSHWVCFLRIKIEESSVMRCSFNWLIELCRDDVVRYPPWMKALFYSLITGSLNGTMLQVTSLVSEMYNNKKWGPPQGCDYDWKWKRHLYQKTNQFKWSECLNIQLEWWQKLWVLMGTTSTWLRCRC